MSGKPLLPLFVLALLLGTTASYAIDEIVLDPTERVQSTSEGSSVVDVPTYRVGDEWVYETKFDIAQLLAQANVSATLNNITGDTSNEVTDIGYHTDSDGTTVLAYTINIDGSFTSALDQPPPEETQTVAQTLKSTA